MPDGPSRALRLGLMLLVVTPAVAGATGRALPPAAGTGRTITTPAVRMTGRGPDGGAPGRVIATPPIRVTGSRPDLTRPARVIVTPVVRMTGSQPGGTPPGRLRAPTR